MPSGKGSQWVEYDVGADDIAIHQLHLTIPPLPAGPLSVRHFHIEACREPPPPPEGHPPSAPPRVWKRASPDLTTLDVPSRQSFAITPPIERRRYVRVVCKMNAAAAMLDEMMLTELGVEDVSSPLLSAFGLEQIPTSVGYFSCAFA